MAVGDDQFEVPEGADGRNPQIARVTVAVEASEDAKVELALGATCRSDLSKRLVETPCRDAGSPALAPFGGP